MGSEFPSAVLNKGPTWRGLGALKFLVIFGDSYSDVGYEYADASIPSDDEPLGVEFPGATYAEVDQANWVGHFVTNYAASQLLVYDYAKGGSRVHNMRNQVEVMFQRQISHKPAWAPWTAEDTLFITWVGINDAAWGSDQTQNVETLFNSQGTLYINGARNFLFVNVPAINRSPAKGRAPNYVNWNVELNKSAALFARTHPDATVMIYSAWDTFNAMFDDPVAHGFPLEDTSKACASMWVDHLHPTSKVHDFVARDMSAFLSAQSPTDT
ncbi:hypothetical protein C8R47DRAFT_1117936 [Mycena vitilis]|nr:hypothetical protein C8R47DRAFT_1117936 [Mycena vitilis]